MKVGIQSSEGAGDDAIGSVSVAPEKGASRISCPKVAGVSQGTEDLCPQASCSMDAQEEPVGWGSWRLRVLVRNGTATKPVISDFCPTREGNN